jgi:hypothetical protein
MKPFVTQESLDIIDNRKYKLVKAYWNEEISTPIFYVLTSLFFIYEGIGYYWLYKN